jgi:o-succinylbenzoate synthase
MRIHKIYLGEMKVPLITPFKTALRTVYEANTILVAIEAEDGTVGYGEAPPTAVITGDTKESIDAAIRYFIGPQIMGLSLDEWPFLMQKLHGAIVRNTSAKAAVDMALYDLKAKLISQPLYTLLDGTPRKIQTDCTISINSAEEMVRDVQLAEHKGFEILKIKIGKNAEEDYKRLKAISEVIKSTTRLRLDANQGWTREEAVAVIQRIERLPLTIELIEQPVHALDFEGMKYVKDRITLPLLADESVFSPEDAKRIIEMGAADLINIKLMKSGGIYKALEINQIAEENGIPCMIGCMLETTVGVSAAGHLAAATKNMTRADLDGPLLCSQVPTFGGAEFEGQWISLSDAPGTGISGIKPEFISRPLKSY